MIAEAVALQQQLTIFNHQQTPGVIFHHVVIQRETLAVDLVGKVRPVEVLFRQFESVVPLRISRTGLKRSQLRKRTICASPRSVRT